MSKLNWAKTHCWLMLSSVLAASLCLAGCDAKPLRERNEAQESPTSTIAATAKPDSLLPYRLGMTLNEAITAHPGVTWNATFVDECIRDMALKGCFLSISDANGAFITEGMNLSPALEFNRFGKLRRVQFGYDRRNDISKDECLGLAGRLLDHVEKNFGPMTVTSRPHDPSDVSAGWRRLQYKTPAGSTLTYGIGPKGNFVLTPAFGGYGAPRPIEKPADIKGIYVSIAGFFITVDSSPNCDISFELSDGNESEAADLG